MNKFSYLLSVDGGCAPNKHKHHLDVIFLLSLSPALRLIVFFLWLHCESRKNKRVNSDCDFFSTILTVEALSLQFMKRKRLKQALPNMLFLKKEPWRMWEIWGTKTQRTKKSAKQETDSCRGICTKVKRGKKKPQVLSCFCKDPYYLLSVWSDKQDKTGAVGEPALLMSFLHTWLH